MNLLNYQVREYADGRIEILTQRNCPGTAQELVDVSVRTIEPNVPAAYDGQAMNQLENLRSATRGALEPFENIAFAFLFGSAVSDRLRRDSDLDVAVYGASAVSLGVPVVIRDHSIFSRREWQAIRSRSASLSPQDRTRLQRILAFLGDELQDASEFSDVDLATYQRERSLRRNLDLRFTRVRRFIDSDIRIIREVIAATRAWMDSSNFKETDQDQ